MKASPSLASRGIAFICITLLVACSTMQTHTTIVDNTISLKPGELQSYGIAFITPSTVTGQEEDKQALALVFTKTFIELRPTTPVVPLSETLGKINQAGLVQDYTHMFNEYRETGLFDRDALRKISQATHARYIAQLKLASFTQESDVRFGLLGLRVLQTRKGNIRIFLQIWDGQEGTIVWEGAQEVHAASETFSEDAVAFRSIVDTCARGLLAKLP